MTSQKRRRHTPDQIIRKLAEGNKLLASGQELDAVCRHVEVAESTGPLDRLADVELLTADWVHWYNTSRLMHRLGRTPPVEFEAAYYAQRAAAEAEAHQ